MSRANASEVELAEPTDEPRTSIEQLYREHRGWLLKFLHRRFGGLVAEELVQEAFTRAIGARREVKNPRAFLASVAVHAALEQASRQPRNLDTLQRPVEVLRVEADQEEAVLLRQLILKLPPALREVFLLSRFGGLSNVEIAHRCNLSVKRVEARITKARAMCTALMRD